MADNWLDSIIEGAPVVQSITELRAQHAPTVANLRYVAGLALYYWAPGSVLADNGTTILAPSNSLDAGKGRWLQVAITSSGSVTLTGDASGSASANTVTHVTGTTATTVDGTSSVSMLVGGSTIATFDASGMLLRTLRYRSGTGAPSAADPNGSIYLRTDGGVNTSLYVRISGAWVAVSTTGTSVTLGGDVTGSSTDCDVVAITGGGTGIPVVRQTIPTTVPVTSSLIFPCEADGPADQWRLLQANGCAPVLWGGPGDGANTFAHGATATIRIIRFGLLASQVQSFMGKAIIWVSPNRSESSSGGAPVGIYREIPIGAYTYDDGGVHALRSFAIGPNISSGPYPTTAVNSGYALRAFGSLVSVPMAWETNYTSGDFGSASVQQDATDPTYRALDLRVAAPLSSSIAWSANPWWDGYRVRVMIQGMWMLEPSRPGNYT